MSTYTPTVEEARLVWQEWNGYGGLINRTGPEPTTRADMRAEFDRMIAEVERAAAARALEEFADQMTTGFNAGTLNAERRVLVLRRTDKKGESSEIHMVDIPCCVAPAVQARVPSIQRPPMRTERV